MLQSEYKQFHLLFQDNSQIFLYKTTYQTPQIFLYKPHFLFVCNTPIELLLTNPVPC